MEQVHLQILEATPPEATWRLLGFPISEMTPSVYHLQLHLDGQQFVYFKSTQTINSIVNNPMIRKTMLTEFFVMNRENKDALLYKEFKHIECGHVENKRKAYDIILDRIFKNKCGAFFIDGPGGTGKIFLYRALLATVRSKGFVALATATSGVIASILPGGKTAHPRFKFPIDIDKHFSCNISKQSSLASLIRDAKLIMWDEVSMAKKQLIEAFDLLLKDLMDTKTLFGAKVVVFGGDFRQTLPVVRSGKKEDFIQESLLCSEIWNQLEKLRLSVNMRARIDPAFCDYLMRIGSGKEKLNFQGKIEIPDCFIIPFISEKESLNLLFRITYPDLYTSTCDMSSTNSRVLLHQMQAMLQAETVEKAKVATPEVERKKLQLPWRRWNLSH
ncbi:PREDICTED: uncharacterized protein LOC109209740 [Nicotiana attenuata]|uniref:uncharacterized protein LOC109209740 n=1 Tax=Nicotiana attenuata TaxID=49451 RepID=UPI000904CBEA|nr:PREDICTED: uncharacterized protein LOC109209740 [Nicotiana attenuata]